MEAKSPRFKEITPSEHSWERAALDFVRQGLPDHEPYRAWSNFELVALDGSINEVDLLVFSPKGLFLVEIKSLPGVVEGDAGTWTWSYEGKKTTRDNPLLLANRKAKKLKSLLAAQPAMRKLRAPYVEARIFLSHESNRSQLAPHLRAKVHARDRVDGKGEPIPGIVAALTRWTSADSSRRRLDRPLAKAVARALEQAGIRSSQRARQVSDYRLDELLFEGPNYQDWAATHVQLERDLGRVRIYSLELGASAETREQLERAARREYEILREIHHEGILKAKHYTRSERGPALIFEHFPQAQRLDHYLAERGESLSVDQRFELLRQVAEAIRFAHGQRVVHRALSPQSILVLDPAQTIPKLQIFNWQGGARLTSDSESTSVGVSATTHLEDLVEDATLVYMAPEALTSRHVSAEQDVFSLGALAFHLFAGQPPAASLDQLNEKLQEGKGLQISAVLNGAHEDLELLVQGSTDPEVINRSTVDEFMALLSDLEDALTTPDVDADVVRDPTQAGAKDRLEHGLTVKKRLGKGSTAVALLVEREGEEQVLKIALEASDNERLRSEAAVLAQLHHQYIVQLREVLEFGDRVGLLLDVAGDHTLGQRLRKEGRLQLELLERFGEDLLDTVNFLEQQGVAHRDIKPENLGVRSIGRGDQLHLVLFDFSLSRVPATNIRAGTVPYIDPFLIQRKPVRWDAYAERYAVAVTLYQMATGQLPIWGDGRSDPALLEVEASLDGEGFDAAVRDKMTAFFTKALRRHYRQRFDNAFEMLRAWREVFLSAGEPVVESDHDDGDGGLDLEEVTLPTPLVLLGLSNRALNALERLGVVKVEDLLRTPLARISRMRGVGTKTRREIARFYKPLAERFPKIEQQLVDDLTDSEDELVIGNSVDTLARQLLPTRLPKRAAVGPRALRAFLDLPHEDDEEPAPSLPPWPSLSDVARAFSISRERVRQVLTTARQRWLRSPGLTVLRDEIATLLDGQGGVMSAAELAAAVLAHRGSVMNEPHRTRLARAVTRAAVESEGLRTAPRWILRRPTDGHYLLVARDTAVPDGDGADGQTLADYAVRLGNKADELAQVEPLLSPERVREALESVRRPEGMTSLTAGRLLHLAVVVSRRAALSGRLELYPRGMSAMRAVKLSLGALAGAAELKEGEVRARVQGRYPEAEPLPARPLLDRLLEEAGSELSWEEDEHGSGCYRSKHRSFTTLATGSSLSRPPSVAPRFDEVSLEAIEIQDFTRRLRSSHARHQFLALISSPKRVLRAEDRLRASFELETVSLDALLIAHMQRFAAARRVDWDLVLRTDATAPERRAGDRGWRHLMTVVRAAVDGVRAELSRASRHVLLLHLGLLARYDQLALLDELRDTTGRPGGPPGLWLLVPGDGQEERPVLDGRPIPVFSTAQWARIPEPWLRVDEEERTP